MSLYSCILLLHNRAGAVMTDLLKTYEEALKLTYEQITDIEERIKKEWSLIKKKQLEKSLYIAIGQQMDIKQTINEIKSYIKKEG